MDIHDLMLISEGLDGLLHIAGQPGASYCLITLDEANVVNVSTTLGKEEALALIEQAQAAFSKAVRGEKN